MLKPRKCRKALVIITPKIQLAVGKRLITLDGKWVSEQFSEYLSRCTHDRKCAENGRKPKRSRQQCTQVARVLGSAYGWYMKNNFPTQLVSRAITGAYFKPSDEPVLTSQVRTDKPASLQRLQDAQTK